MIERYLIKNDYTDDKDKITDSYHQDRKYNDLAKLPDDLLPFNDQIVELINGVFSQAQLPEIADDRAPKINPLNTNFDKKEFQKLWNKINKKAEYKVNFDSNELIENCIAAIDKELSVTPLQYTITQGEQKAKQTDEMLKQGASFKVTESKTEYETVTIHSSVK